MMKLLSRRLLLVFALLCSVITTAVYGQNSISTNQLSYAYNEPIVISWSYTDWQDGDWIALYPSTVAPPLPAGSTMWIYIQTLTQDYVPGQRLTGNVTFDSNLPEETGTQGWPLRAGSYRVHIVRDVSSPYPVVVSSANLTVTPPPPMVLPPPPPPSPFVPSAPSSPVSSHPACIAATTAVSTTSTHIPPLDNTVVSKIGFGSCYQPSRQRDASLWQHVRNELGYGSNNSNDNNGVWVWLGDNMYADTDNADRKRLAYNTARNDPFYRQYGPVADPKIPTAGTWDGTYIFCKRNDHIYLCMYVL
jgi:hypothetical protein